MKPWALVALCCVAWTGAIASVPAPPPEVQRALPEVKLQGEARMSFLGLRVYDARLWLPPQADALRYDETPLALALHYLRRLDGPAIAERSITEMRRVGSFSDAQASAWLEAMKRAYHGEGGADALAWIEALLAREGIPDADGEIWLHTYPRVLGYVFKPVSFWSQTASCP